MIRCLLPKFWLRRTWISYLLIPVSLFYRCIIVGRRICYKIFKGNKLKVPVIVVGNLTVGGAGKTPLVIYLVGLLKNHGYKVGVISRGYGRKSREYLVVSQNSRAIEVGDEPLLIFNKARVIVVVGEGRFKTAEIALTHGCNVIISDDGLQHYSLMRDIEIVVIDQGVKFGNGFCLPAGPLREPVARLNQADFIVTNFNSDEVSYAANGGNNKFLLEAKRFRNLVNEELFQTPEFFIGKIVHAVAAIGRPQKFFDTLHSLGLCFVEHSFPDHHMFSKVDLSFANEEIVVMTEKDSVKCKDWAGKNFWSLEVMVKADEDFDRRLLERLQGKNF